jgi:hypothetical protein
MTALFVSYGWRSGRIILLLPLELPLQLVLQLLELLLPVLVPLRLQPLHGRDLHDVA